MAGGVLFFVLWNFVQRNKVLSLSMTTEEIQVLFDTWGISRSTFARIIGMKRGTFYNKMDPRQPWYNFTSQELARVNLALSELKKALPDG